MSSGSKRAHKKGSGKHGKGKGKGKGVGNDKKQRSRSQRAGLQFPVEEFAYKEMADMAELNFFILCIIYMI